MFPFYKGPLFTTLTYPPTELCIHGVILPWGYPPMGLFIHGVIHPWSYPIVELSSKDLFYYGVILSWNGSFIKLNPFMELSIHEVIRLWLLFRGVIFPWSYTLIKLYVYRVILP